MSIVLSDRSTERASSLIVLGVRVVYCDDSTHPNHSGLKRKTIYPARNYNVTDNDQSSGAFIKEVKQLHTEYIKFRHGKPGKWSRRLFEEIIYSSQKAAWLSEEERHEIERRIISRFGGMSICRAVWHVDEQTGRSDLHVLLSAKNLDFPPKMTLWAEFGGWNQEHLYGAMDILDVEITRYLNRTPERKKAKLHSARRRRKDAAVHATGKRIPLAEELAQHFRNRNITGEISSDAIIDVMESLGHEIIHPVGRSIRIRFKGKTKIFRYNFNTLQDETALACQHILHDIKHAHLI